LSGFTGIIAVIGTGTTGIITTTTARSSSGWAI
jgi:hypothetical protein